MHKKPTAEIEHLIHSSTVYALQVTFVGEGFTRKAPKYERFIRPTGLRFKKAHVTHPELKATFHLDIIGVKKNPSSPLYTQVMNWWSGQVFSDILYSRIQYIISINIWKKNVGHIRDSVS